MTKITPSSVTSDQSLDKKYDYPLISGIIDPSVDKKHDYPLRSGIKDSKNMKKVLSLDNLLTPPKKIQEEWPEPRLYTRQKEKENEKEFK